MSEQIRAALLKLKAKTPELPDGSWQSSIDAPQPRLRSFIESEGESLSAQALNAWENRVRGVPVVDIANGMHLSIDTVKELIREVHSAIRDDLKDSIELNRTLDLERIDGLLQTFYPLAKEGDTDAANLLVKAVSLRSRIAGTEPQPDRLPVQQPQNVLVWIQSALPNITRLVESLPVE